MKRAATLLGVMAVSLASGCKDSNEYTVGVTKPLLVIGVSPSGDDVNLEPVIRVVFSDDIDPATVDDATVTLTDASGAVVPADRSYDAATFTVTVDPTVVLAYSAEYTLTVRQLERESDGAVLAAPVTTVFKTQDPPPLAVIATSPSGGADEVGLLVRAPDGPNGTSSFDMVVTFSEPVRTASVVLGSSFQIAPSDAQGSVVDGTLSWDATETILTFTVDPADNYELSQEYRLYLSAAIESQRATLEGGQLETPVVNLFKTLDPPELTLIAASPTGQGDNVALDPVEVTLFFSEPVDANSVDDTTIFVNEGLTSDLGTSLATSVTVDGTDPRRVHLTFEMLALPLKYTQQYTVTIEDSVQSVIATAEGGQVGMQVLLTWKTIDPPPLTLVSLSPHHLADDVSRTTQVRAVFDRAVDAGTVTSLNFFVTDTAMTLIPSTVMVDLAGDPTGATVLLTIDPGSLPLGFTKSYQTHLVGGPTGLAATDATAEGGWLSVDVDATWKTVDPPPLTVIASSPSGGAASIDSTATVQVIFDRAIDGASIAAASFFLEYCAADPACGAPTPVASTLSVPLADKAVLTPSSPLDFDAFYRVTLTTAIRAADATAEGGTLGNTVQLVFETLPVPPLLVSSVDPLNGATGEAQEKTIAVTFNAPVFETTLEADGDANGFPNFYVTSSGAPDTGTPIPLPAMAAAVISLSADQKTAFLDPSTDLTADTVYTVVVEGGGGGAIGQLGQTLPATFTSTFRTRVAQLVLSTDPVSDEGIAPPVPSVDVDRVVTVNFAECMDTTTIDLSSFQVTYVDAFGRTLPLTGAISFMNTMGCVDMSGDTIPGANIAIFTPSLDDYDCLADAHALLFTTTYTATLASSIYTEDQLQTVVGGFTWNFRTGTAPGVSRLLAENASVSQDLLLPSPTDVPINTVFVAEFDRDMDGGTITTTTFFVNPGVVSNSPAALAATGVVYDPVTRTAVLTLAAALSYATPYTVTLDGGPGGIEDGDGNPLEGDTTATFTSSSAMTGDAAPDGVTNLARNSSVVIALDREIDPLTVTDATFKLTDTTLSKQLTGLVAISPDKKTLSFTPVPLLAGGDAHEIRLTTSVRDSRGNPLSADIVRTFATAGGNDAADPSLFSISPANAAVNQLGNVKISATLSEHMIPASARASIPPSATVDSFRVSTGGVDLAGTLSYTFDDVNERTTATFTPVAFLSAGTVYTVTLGDKISDLARRPFAGSVSTFTVEGVAGAPTFGGSAPGGGSADVDADTLVAVTFVDAASDVLRSTSVDGTSLQLLDGAMAPVPVTYSVSGKVATMRPPLLLGGVTYTVSAPAGGVDDSAGNGLAAAGSTTFTVDALRPRVSTQVVSPANLVTLSFVDDSGADRIKPGTVTASSVGLPGSGTVQVHLLDMPGGSPLAEVFGCLVLSDSTVTWDPATVQPLVTGSSYRVTVTTGLQDLGSLPLDQDGVPGNGNQLFEAEFTAN